MTTSPIPYEKEVLTIQLCAKRTFSDKLLGYLELDLSSPIYQYEDLVDTWYDLEPPLSSSYLNDSHPSQLTPRPLFRSKSVTLRRSLFNLCQGAHLSTSDKSTSNCNSSALNQNFSSTPFQCRHLVRHEKQTGNALCRLHLRFFLSRHYEAINNFEPDASSYYYDQYIGQFKTGDILLYSGVGCLDTLIRLYTGFKYTRFAIIICIPNRYTKQVQPFIFEICQNLSQFQDAFRDTKNPGCNFFRFFERLHEINAYEVLWLQSRKEFDHDVSQNIIDQLFEMTMVKLQPQFFQLQPPKEFLSFFKHYGFYLYRHLPFVFELSSFYLVKLVLRLANCLLVQSQKQFCFPFQLLSQSFYEKPVVLVSRKPLASPNIHREPNHRSNDIRPPNLIPVKFTKSSNVPDFEDRHEMHYQQPMEPIPIDLKSISEYIIVHEKINVPAQSNILTNINSANDYDSLLIQDLDSDPKRSHNHSNLSYKTTTEYNRPHSTLNQSINVTREHTYNLGGHLDSLNPNMEKNLNWSGKCQGLHLNVGQYQSLSDMPSDLSSQSLSSMPLFHHSTPVGYSASYSQQGFHQLLELSSQDKFSRLHSERASPHPLESQTRDDYRDAASITPHIDNTPNYTFKRDPPCSQPSTAVLTKKDHVATNTTQLEADVKSTDNGLLLNRHSYSERQPSPYLIRESPQLSLNHNSRQMMVNKILSVDEVLVKKQFI